MNRQSDFLGRFFDLRKGEAVPLLWLFLLSFFKGASAVLFDTAANTHFVKIYGAGRLPMIYLAAAAVSLLVGSCYSACATRINIRKMLPGTLGFAGLSILVMYAGFIWYPAPSLALAAMVWKEALFILSNIVLWATAGYLLDLRQGKRLFGLVAAGGILASITGGLGIPWLVKTFGLSQLFPLSALAMAAAVGCLAYIARKFPDHFTSSPEDSLPRVSAPSTHREPWWSLFRNRYLGLFLSLSILSNFGFFFADYVYFNRVGNAFHQEADLASFFGRFSAVLGAVQLLSSLFLAGPIITRCGLGLALMALPLINGLGMTVAAIISFSFGLNATFFWLIIAIKLCDEALRASLLAPAFRILYQPLPFQERLAFQAKTESIIEPLGVGLVGAVLVLLTSVWPVSLPLLCLILVVILAIWIGVAELLRHEYAHMLTKALSRPRLSHASILLEDAAAATILLRGTRSDNPGEVIYCLNALEESVHEAWQDKLAEALIHSDAQVREYALSRIEEKCLKSLKNAVRERWQKEGHASNRRAAVQTYCALGEEEVVEEVSDLLSSSDESLRIGSILGLLRFGGMEGVLLAGTHLQAMLQSPLENHRKQAAEILGRMGLPNFYRPILELMKDPSDEVRRAAIRSAGKLRNLRLIPGLLENLHERAHRSHAANALRQFGPSVVPLLQEAFTAAQSLPLRRALVQILSQIGGPEATQILVQQLPAADKSLRGQILSALGQLKFMASPEVVPILRTLILQITSEAAAKVQTQAQFVRSQQWPLIAQAMALELRGDRAHLLTLLSFLPGSQALRHLERELQSSLRTQRARALELLETVMPGEFKTLLPLFFDDLTLDQQADRIASTFGQPLVSPEEQLVTLANDADQYLLRWTKACALYEIGRSRLRAGESAVRANLSAPEPILQETAEWTVQQLSV